MGREAGGTGRGHTEETVSCPHTQGDKLREVAPLAAGPDHEAVPWPGLTFCASSVLICLPWGNLSPQSWTDKVPDSRL